MGDFLLAGEHFEMAISLYDRHRHHRGYFELQLMTWGSALYLTGLYPVAARLPRPSSQQDQSSCNLSSGVITSLWTGNSPNISQAWSMQSRREARAAQDTAERLIALTAQHGFAPLLASARLARLGPRPTRARRGRDRSDQGGSNTLQAAGIELGRPYWLSQLAEACTKAGRFDEG